MGRIRPTSPVKLVLPMFTAYPELFAQAKEAMAARYGPVDYVSQSLPFNYTHYYEREFGETLERRFVAFKRLIAPQELADCKVMTNDLEEALGVRRQGQLMRRINLDPGYLALGKLVLASTKDHSHRIYMGQGIFAEVTLAYRDKPFQPWPWTYPDYQSAAYHAVLQEIRSIYAAQLKALRAQGLLD